MGAPGEWQLGFAPRKSYSTCLFPVSLTSPRPSAVWVGLPPSALPKGSKAAGKSCSGLAVSARGSQRVSSPAAIL